MSELSVDRLTLRMSGLSAGEGRRFAALLAECLAQAALPPGARGGPSLRLSITAQTGESLESMARKVAAELTAAVARST